MGTDPSRWYPSKVDWWVAAVLAVGPITCAVAVIVAARAGEGSAVAAAATAVVGAVYLGLLFPMRYGIGDEALVIRHGLVRQRVRLPDISEVKPTRNPLSSPALSLDRLAIRFGAGNRSVMISPADRDGFLTELATRAGLHRDGEALVRPPT